LKKIPRGKVITYREIAIALGNPNASRAVGNACNKNPFAPKVPCHRVVKSNGFLGGYAEGLKNKIFLLEKEGVKIKNNKIVNFNGLKICARDLK
jgi:methylated-DNA-[protein]-cysteine S-methyltransferase